MFRGRPLEERTEYEYDDAGRVIRSRTYREAEWTTEDQAEVLALALHEQSLCPCGCGYTREVAWHDDNDGYFDMADDDRVCYARQAIDRWREDQGENPERPHGWLGPSLRYTRPDDKPLPLHSPS